MPSLRSAAQAAVLAGAVAAALADPVAADVAGRRTIDLPLLLDLPGDLAFVRYTPGTLDRSAAVQSRFELLCDEFQRSGYKATSLVFYVLVRDDWNEAKLARPYGDPEPLDLDAVAVPGWADAKLVERYRELLGGELPIGAGRPVLVSPAEAAALSVADLFVELEAARILVARAGIRGDRPWIEPLVAHLVARLAWDKYEPGRIRAIAAIFDRMATTAATSIPAADAAAGAELLPRLADWRTDLPLAERSRYDARFLRGADAMVASGKSSHALWKLLREAQSGKEPLTEALLFDKFPALAGWVATNFAP